MLLMYKEYYIQNILYLHYPTFELMIMITRLTCVIQSSLLFVVQMFVIDQNCISS